MILQHIVETLGEVFGFHGLAHENCDPELTRKWKLFCQVVLKIENFDGKNIHCWRLAVRLLGLDRAREINNNRKWHRKGKGKDPDIMTALVSKQKDKVSRKKEFDQMLNEASEKRWDICVFDGGDQ